jgi:hypothetical protein
MNQNEPTEHPHVISTRLGRLHFGGCTKHPERVDPSCAKIRREDGTALTMQEAWELVLELWDIQQTL